MATKKELIDANAELAAEILTKGVEVKELDRLLRQNAVELEKFAKLKETVTEARLALETVILIKYPQAVAWFSEYGTLAGEAQTPEIPDTEEVRFLKLFHSKLKGMEHTINF